jgi:hypothetical protein
MNQLEARQVVHCNKSTIVQAWAALIGTPGPPSQDERFAAVVEWQASKLFDGMRPVPSIVIVPSSEKMIEPHWIRQLAWGDQEQYLARFGARYLSVHFLASPASFSEARYRTYEQNLEPMIRGWIDSFREACLDDSPECSKLVFGYINSFSLPIEDIDISQYFAMDIGLSNDVAVNGLSSLSATFGLPEDDSGHRIVIAIEADTSGDLLTVETRVEASCSYANNLPRIADSASMLPKIKEVKEAAKTAFFKFATPKTHQLMEATYDTA